MTTATGRRLDALALLQARPGISAAELARRLDVTERTARRDIAHLRELGYRIEAQPGRHGGYHLVSGTTLPALMLDEHELLAVALGLRSATGVADLGTAAATALAKLAVIVPPRLRHRLGALADLAPSDQRRRQADGEVLVALALACRQGEAVRLHRRADERPRTVQPAHLVHGADTWYLVACERDVGEWRTWALDRIQRVEPLGTTLPTPPPPDDAVEFVTRSLARGRRHAVRLRAHASAEVVRWVVPATVAKVVETPGGSCELRLATDDLRAAARWVASLGFDVDVIEPDELRRHVAEFGARLAARHGGV